MSKAPILKLLQGNYFISLVILIGLLLTFSISDRNFLTSENFVNILLQSSVLLIIAMPLTLVVMTEGIDISVGAVLSLATVVFGLTLVGTGSLPLALGAAALAGLAFGALNGGLISYLNLPPFIATLGIMGFAQSIALLLTDGESVTGIPSSVSDLYWQSWYGIPLPLVFAFATFALFYVILYHTRFGNYVVALGGNRSALRLAGVNTRVVLMAVYIVNGLVVGLAGRLMTARMNAGHPTGALGIEFDAIAAIAIGGTSFAKGEGRLVGTLIGTIIIGVMRNGLSMLAFSASLQLVCLGALLIAALTFDRIRKQAQ